MHARILFGGLLPAVLAACSEPAARPALERSADATLSARPTLAFSAAAGTDVPVASDLEINLPKPKPERPRTAKPRRKVAPPVASEPVAQSVTKPAEVEVQHNLAVQPDAAPTLTGPTMQPKIEEEPRASAPPEQPSPEPSAPGADDHGTPRPDDGIDGGRPAHGPGVIIVRGGDSGGGDDPCRIDGPGRGHIGGGSRGGGGGPAGIGIRGVVGRGAAGVLINDRAPRIGGGRFYPRGMGR